MEKAKIDEFLTLRFRTQLISPKGGWGGGGSQQKRKAIFFSKLNFLLNALGFTLVNQFPAEL